LSNSRSDNRQLPPMTSYRALPQIADGFMAFSLCLSRIFMIKFLLVMIRIFVQPEQFAIS